MLANKTFCLWTEVHRTFFLKCGGNRSRSHFSPILDIGSRSGDIRDQNQKLSKITPNFGRFFRPAFQKLYPCYDSCLAIERRVESFVRILPLAQKL